MSEKIKCIAVTAIGTALFVVLSLCLQVPVFENYYLCLGYAVMAVFCYCFGTLSGTAVGFFGVILYCLLINGLRGMPGWALGNIVIGVALGIVFRLTDTCRRRWLVWLLYSLTVLASVALGILVVKSLTECLLYSQPFLLRAGKNVYAFVADVVVLLISLPLCVGLYGQAKRILPSVVRKASSSALDKTDHK